MCRHAIRVWRERTTQDALGAPCVPQQTTSDPPRRLLITVKVGGVALARRHLEAHSATARSSVRTVGHGGRTAPSVSCRRLCGAFSSSLRHELHSLRGMGNSDLGIDCGERIGLANHAARAHMRWGTGRYRRDATRVGGLGLQLTAACPLGQRATAVEGSVRLLSRAAASTA